MRRAALIVSLFALACRNELPFDTGLFEPVRLEEGFFLDGELPVAASGPAVTSVETSSGFALVGADGRARRGRADDDAWALGVRFADVGTGWWVHTVGDEAAQFPGERDFSLSYDVGIVPQGTYTMRLAAIDGDGARGEPYDFDICVLDDAMPANFNPCDPSNPDLPPPAAAIVLSWNRPVDLDLVARGPDGERVSWKAPTTDPAATEDDLDVGRLDRDSNAGCIADGRNSEAIVWEAAPTSGEWSAYVDLFDACGEADVTYTVVFYHAVPHGDGTMRLAEIDRRTGNLVAQLDAYGGAKPPLFVMSAELP
ncbi:MAG TPA: hypothetical protein VG755_16030 [Nannocystaceae bacterium]|nr:hypothetical protein [Nannocystaceae bacterium]